MNIPKAFFIISITCILFLSSFFIASQIYHNNIPIDIQRDYHQISKNIQSTNENVSIIELSNKIILTSYSKEPTNIKILNPKYKSYQINHYDDNGNLISSKIVNSTEIQCLSITEWSTYEILGIDNISYGDGWTHYSYTDGTQARKLAPTNYLRWDGEWRPKIEMNYLSSDWPYLVEEFETYYLITRLDDNLTLLKTYRTYDFQPYKIGVRLTLTPLQLNGISTYHNVGGTDYWYITIPRSLKETSKHLNWDNKIPTISNETGFILNQSENVSGEWLPNYKYRNVGGKLRLYYNQVARDFGIDSTEVTFYFNSYIINSSTGWANTSYSNFAYDRNTGHIILPDNATNGLVMYHKMSGSSGITSYDMNLTSDNNGTLTNMNTGLDNGSSGWNSSGKYGHGLAFDGVDDYVDVGSGNSLNIISSFTFDVWIKPNTVTSQYQDIISRGVNNYYRYDMFLNYDEVMIFIGYGAGFSTWTTTVANITALSWSHIGTVFDDSADTIKVYVNGRLVETFSNVTVAPGSNPTGNLNLGRIFSGSSYHFNGSIDSVRIYNRALSNDEINQTMNNTMKTSDNVTHWHNAGTGYQTTSFIVNMTTPVNTNYTVWYADNGSSFVQIGGVLTGNQTPSISGTKYQNTDLRIVMNGNMTATPEEMEVTFVTEASAAGATPNITSWQNNKTSNNTLDFTINTSEEVNFNATANQTITTWNWHKDSVDQSHNYDNITLNWSSTGLKHVVVNATNANGTSSSITWNITVQGAEPVITLLSQIPSIIYKNSTGCINISYGITHDSSGLNNTSVSFIYRNYDYDLSDSNHSIRPPTNDLTSVWNFNGRILRAANRNESLNFENNATITGGDTYTWSGLDENSTKLTIVPVNSTYTKVYINATVHCIMPQMWYLDRTDQQEATKTQLPIHKTQNVLIKFWNFEIFKGNYNFLGVGYTDTLLSSNPALWPSDANPVNFYYVSSGYDPATGGDPITSGYAVYMGSLNASGWTDHIYSRSNSNYVRGFIDNNYLHTVINTTNISYLYFTSNTESSKPYYINMTNVATSTNRSFANTNTLWAGNNPPFTPQLYTPNVWFAFMKLNMSLDHKLYVADNNDLWGSSSMSRTNITQALFPPTTPTIDHFHFLNETDYDMNGVYYGNFSIGCGVSSDPDGGDVTHNLTLHYANNLTVVTIINNTFTDKDITHNGVYFDANFSSILYYSQTDNYTLRLIATDDESETVTVWLNKNFSLDGSPRIISYSPETPISSSEGENQTFSITTNLPGNVTWYLDSVEVFNETNVNSSSYSNSTAAIGTYNITVVTTNINGTNSMTWDWTVELVSRIPLSIFIMWSIIMFTGAIIGFMTTGLYGITSSLLTATIAYMNSKNIINGNVVQYFSGVSTSDTIVVGYRSIESLPMSYIYLFIAIVMVIVFILQVKNEIQYNLEPDMDGDFFDE